MDRSRCSGHARCFAVDPDLFPLDDDGYSALEDTAVPEGKESAARDGAASCPEQAISLHA